MEKPLTSHIVYTCPIFKIEEATVELPTGAIEQRWYLVKKDAAFVVPVRDGKILMIKEFRSGSGSKEWRVPAGGVKDGETPEQAGIREVREEIGLEPKQIRLIETIKSPTSYIKQKLHFLVASDFIEHPLDSGEYEDIEKYEFTFEDVRTMLRNSEITDSIIARALLKVVRGEVPL